MLKIKNERVKWVDSYADYELENGVLLFIEDWNTSTYGNGFDPKTMEETNIEYDPVFDDEGNIIGFEER